MSKQKISSMVIAFFLVFQVFLEKASALPLLPTAIPTIAPVSNPVTNPASQPEQNLNADARTPSLASQLLNLLGQGAVAVQGPASSELIFAILAPLSYNTNPGLAPGTALPAWDFDPEVELLHSAPLGNDLLLTEILEADTAIYFDNSGYNLNTVSGQVQVNFTDEGIHFDASPFVAYRVGYTVPANFSGHAWVNDVEVGYNFNRILDSGVMDPLEIDFNPGISQRWIQTDDGMGDTSATGSTALEVEVPFIYKFTPRLNLIFDFTTFVRYYNINQAPNNEDRVDEAFSLPLSLGWTMVPSLNLKIQAQGGYTQQFSSVADQNITQITTGINLLMAF